MSVISGDYCALETASIDIAIAVDGCTGIGVIIDNGTMATR